MKISLIGLIAGCAVSIASVAAQPGLADMPGNHPPQVSPRSLPADMPGNHPPQIAAGRLI